MKSNSTIKVLMFYDIKGWAWWNRINNITKYQPAGIKVDSIQLTKDFDPNKYDFIVMFDSFRNYTRIISKVPAEKLIIGCSCSKYINEYIKALKFYKPLAGMVNSREMYNLSKDYYKVFNCPNGVEVDLFKPGINKINNLTACWVGNSGHPADKGLNQIRKVCETANIPLNVFDLSNNQNRILLPHIELRDKIYYKSNFYICFSEYEGTPNPALEALSCGLPVITTRVGNMPELIIDGYNGFFADRDENSLYNTILKLKESDIHTMSVNARKSILNGWSWEHQAKNYTEMFKILRSEI